MLQRGTGREIKCRNKITMQLITGHYSFQQHCAAHLSPAYLNI